MKTRYIIMFAISLLLISMLSRTSATTVVVDDDDGHWADYHSIHEAVKSSASIIRIYEGYYYENESIDAPCLIGNGSDNTIVHTWPGATKGEDGYGYLEWISRWEGIGFWGEGDCTGFLLKSDSVEFLDCSFGNFSYRALQLWGREGGSISNCSFFNNSNGLTFWGSDYCNASRCTFFNNGKGLVVWGAKYCTISRIRAYNNSNGIEMWGGDYTKIISCECWENGVGVYFWGGENNTVVNCILNNNTIGAGGSGHWNTLTGCTITNNTVGVKLHGTHHRIESCLIVNNSLMQSPYYYYSGGIDLGGSSCIISNCTIFDNAKHTALSDGSGVSIWGSRNLMTGCIVANNSLAPNDYDSYGINVQGYNNTITDCQIIRNNGSGIRLAGQWNEVSDCLISGNAGYGIYGFFWSNNTVVYNDLKNNTLYAIHLENCTNFTINHNDFWTNGIDPLSQAYDANGTNTWDDGSKGNFWSDYKGVDADQDGIGEVPYPISGGNATDDHPLIFSGWGTNQAPVVWIDASIPNFIGTGSSVALVAYYNDTDGKVVRFEWSSSIDGVLYNDSERNVTIDDLSIGHHVITLRGQDNRYAWSDPASINLTVLPEPWIQRLDVSASLVILGANVSLNCSVPVDAQISRYVWFSSIDGVLGNGSEGNISATLSSGSHEIFLKVQNLAGIWSDEVSSTVIVNSPPVVTRIKVEWFEGTGAIRIAGNASDIDSVIRWVEVSIDGGTWWIANGTEHWYLEFYQSDLESDRFTISVRCWDEHHYSKTLTLKTDLDELKAKREEDVHSEAGLIVGVAVTFGIISLVFGLHSLRKNE